MTAIERRWRESFGKAVDGPNTIECDSCNQMVLGDSPTIVVTCLDCFRDQLGWEEK